jgi:hypothetical protein
VADVRVGDSDFSLVIEWHRVNCSITVFQATLFQAHHGIYCILLTVVTDIPLFIHAGVVNDG